MRLSARARKESSTGSRVPIATISIGRAYLATLEDVARAGLTPRLEAKQRNAWPRVGISADEARAHRY